MNDKIQVNLLRDAMDAVYEGVATPEQQRLIWRELVGMSIKVAKIYLDAGIPFPPFDSAVFDQDDSSG